MTDVNGSSYKSNNSKDIDKSCVAQKNIEERLHVNFEIPETRKENAMNGTDFIDNDNLGIVNESREPSDINRDEIVDEIDVIDESVVENSKTIVRRSNRSNKGVPPKYFIEEVNVVINGEPGNYNDAVISHERDKWIQAMEEEISSLIDNDTWSLTEVPIGKNTIGCKWVYKLKTDTDGNLKRYKARLVAQGFSQKFGTDYDQVFAPVARHTTFRTLLSVAASRKMNVYHYDAKTAFLNGELKEEIYMRQPPGFVK